MKNKKLIGIIVAAIAVILVCFGVIYVNQAHKDVTQTSKSNDAGLKIQKTKQSNTQNNNSDNYSNDKWMLMGYMAYAHDNYVESRHIKNNSDLVTDVSEDLDSGALKAEKNSANTYTLSNKFGSVDITVENDDVKVENDGTTTTSKAELKRTFSQFESKIQKMTKNISEDGNSNSNNSSSDKNNSDDSDEADGNGPSKQKQEFNNLELITAAYLDGFEASTTQEKIALAKKILAKDNVADKDVPTDDFINGFYKNGDYISIASNLTTSHFAEFKVDENSDDIVKKYGGGGVLQTKHLSKKKIIQTWLPYKNDVDQIMEQIQKNKGRNKAIEKAISGN